jgi:sigma-B regulation protein RsbU (phosphoserine phosphatase)
MQLGKTSDGMDPKSIGVGIETHPEAERNTEKAEGSANVRVISGNATNEAAQALAEHLFAQSDAHIPGLSYALTYKLADGHVGGDLIDVYQFDNDTVSISIADIAGKGTQAAIHAAMIKYGLRAYASLGLTPERVLRSLDRLYLENNAFEVQDSFASVFFGQIDPSRRLFTYASAAHQPVVLASPRGEIRILDITAPLVGVFDDQHHLFKQRFVEIEPGSMLVATTDGITEARNDRGEFYGMDRLVEFVRASHDLDEKEVAHRLLIDAETFSGGRRRDDIAIIAVRFHAS